MKNLKERGITLIALIITIIVLLILAGVTLNIVLNGGIINKSQTAVSKYNEQVTKEKLTLALTEYKFKQLAGETPNLGDIISNIGGELTTEGTETEYVIDLDGYRFTVNKATHEIINIEPSNAQPLNAPTIGAPEITLAGDSKSATIEVTVTAQNGGTLQVTIDGQTATLENGKYKATVTTNGNKTISVTETVGTRKKTSTTPASVTGIQVVVTLTKNDGISSVSGGGTVTQGQPISISATVADGKLFTGWKVTSGNASDVADLKSNPTTVTPTGDIIIKATGATVMATPTAESGYVGCYADIDENGSVDGVIYADLLAQKPTSGKWNNDNNATFTIPPTGYGLTEENVKNYVLSSIPVVSEDFDSTARYVVSLASGDQSSKKDRFYVMGLNDIEDTSENKELYWYKNANMPSTSVTSTDFGTGKTNTETILAKWKPVSDGGYGEPDKTYTTSGKDMWEYVTTGWFVPSRGEWAAFAKAFNISDNSTDTAYYGNFGFSPYYWSSSQISTDTAWLVRLGNGDMDWNYVSNAVHIRLSTTF